MGTLLLASFGPKGRNPLVDGRSISLELFSGIQNSPHGGSRSRERESVWEHRQSSVGALLGTRKWIRGAARSQRSLWAREPLPGVLLDNVQIERNAEARPVGHGEHAVIVEFPFLLHKVVDKRRAREVFHDVRVPACSGQMKISSQAQGRVPAVRNETNTILFGHPRNSALFANATDFRHIGLDNIQGPALEPGDE